MPTESASELNVVTGAFGYTGKYLTQRLLDAGKRVLTLTGHPDRENPFGGRVKPLPFNLDRPAQLVQSLKGVTNFFNTYWQSLTHHCPSSDHAIAISKNPFQRAQ